MTIYTRTSFILSSGRNCEERYVENFVPSLL